MRFPIDVVFLDKEKRVTKIAADLRPWRTAAARDAHAVLELAAGEAEGRTLKVGDRIVEPDSMEKTRGRRFPWQRAGADLVLAALWFAFAIANLHEWPKQHRPVGLGIMLLQLMFAVLFFVRRKPWVTSRAPLAWAATMGGAFLMLAARPASHPAFGLEPLYAGLQLGGAVAAAYTLASLGRSFGLVAANRGIKTGGPYSLVRHPLYLCYVATDLGYVLENPALRNVALLVVSWLCQVVRIRTEEDCLRADPTYVRYCQRVRYRLVPLVW
jgi:protein-S-isoprenylcysteine O-methyltransferase Ste14